MAIRIERQHALGKDEAKRRIEGIRTEVQAQYGLSTSWQGDDLAISGSGVSGEINVEEQYVRLHVRLGFAMMMMEGPIKTQLSAAMDKHLGPVNTP